MMNCFHTLGMGLRIRSSLLVVQSSLHLSSLNILQTTPGLPFHGQKKVMKTFYKSFFWLTFNSEKKDSWTFPNKVRVTVKPVTQPAGYTHFLDLEMRTKLEGVLYLRADNNPKFTTKLPNFLAK